MKKKQFGPFMFSPTLTLAHLVQLLSLSLCFYSCGDPSPSTQPSMQQDMDLVIAEPDQNMIAQDMETLDAATVDMQAVHLEPSIAWIELQISPVRSVYQTSDSAVLKISAYDIYGELNVNHELNFSLSEQIVALSSNEQMLTSDQPFTQREVDLRFIQEGETELRVCVLESTDQSEEVCAKRSILIDDNPPKIEVFWPKRGAMLAATDLWPQWEEVIQDHPEQVELALLNPPLTDLQNLSETEPSHLSQFIPIIGRVEQLGEEGRLTLNGQEITVSESGLFSSIIEQKSGFVQFELIADDGIRLKPTVDKRWILFADHYLPHSEQTSPIEHGIDLAIGQSFIDQDLASLDMPPYQATEIAQLIDLFLGLIQPSRLIAQSQLINSPELSLSIVNIDLGEPNLDLQITANGLALFADIQDVSIEISGALSLVSTQIDLSGTLNLNLSAYADYQLSTGEQTLSVDYLGGGIAITRIDPQLNENAANAIISALDSSARTLIVEQLESQLNLLFQRDIPFLLETTVDDIYQSIQSIPLSLSSGFEGSPAAEIVINIIPSSVTSTPQRQLYLSAAVNIENQSEIVGHEESRGTPSLSSDPLSIDDGSAVSFKLKPELINALLVEVWRSGLLDLSPELPASAALFYSGVTASALCPPILTIGRSNEPFPLYLELGALKLDMTQTASGLADEYEIFIRVGASLLVDGGNFTIQLEEEPKVEVTLSHLANDRPAVTEQLIANIFTQQIWPSLSSSLVGRLALGIPDSPLSLSELSYLGINLNQGWVRPRFDQRVHYMENWITLGGSLLFRFSLSLMNTDQKLQT